MLPKKEQTASKFNPDKFLEALHELLVAHNADFAIIWLRNDHDLITKGWTNSPEGMVMNKIVETWMTRHHDELMTDIIEGTKPKEKELMEAVEELLH